MVPPPFKKNYVHLTNLFELAFLSAHGPMFVCICACMNVCISVYMYVCMQTKEEDGYTKKQICLNRFWELLRESF